MHHIDCLTDTRSTGRMTIANQTARGIGWYSTLALRIALFDKCSTLTIAGKTVYEE